MTNEVAKAFQYDFDRFFTLMIKQVDVCPDDLWAKKAGGYFVWQQIFHAFFCIQFFTGKNEAAPKSPCSPDVAMLSAEPDGMLTKDDVRIYASEIKKVADNYINSVNLNNIADDIEGWSAIPGQKRNNLTGLIGLVRHLSYHLGCVDSIFRDHNIAGVY